MEIPTTTWLIGRIVIWIATNKRNIIDRLISTDPQAIRHKIFEREKDKKIKPIEQKLADQDTEHRKSHFKGELSKLGAKYLYSAQLLWGRGTYRENHKSAWYYVLAGECYEKAGSDDLAAGMYHFAAHGFRETGSLERAVDYYEKAAIIFQGRNRHDDAIRSFKRAIGVSQLAGDADRGSKIRDTLNRLQEQRQ